MQIANLCFLIVDDHEFQRAMLKMMLQSLGAKNIFGAGDGTEALNLLRRDDLNFDIVLSDLEMPGMDGMEFIRHLGESTAGISVILISALEPSLIASVETMARVYGINLLGAIEKPISLQQLQALISLYKPLQANAKSSHAMAQEFTLDEIIDGLKKDEFEPFFQPKTELATGYLMGAEALARWRHPEKGVIPPYAFIKPLEDNGFIDELTWIMLRKTAAFHPLWCEPGCVPGTSRRDVTLSVNLSGKSLGAVALADRIIEIVRAEDFEPRRMVLEVTESAAATDVGIALENLSRLRMKGFGLSIDDYGTGYSSMQQLTRIAFTELKIDRSFVTNAAKHASARVILESSLDMARKLKIRTVAEGVETQSDWDLLHELGCECAQGYFIAKPMDAGAFLDWARDRERSM